jgi:hypothetical protein
LRVHHHKHAVFTIAAYGQHDEFICNAKHGFWIWSKSARLVPPADEACILKLVSFPDGSIASCSKSNKIIHTYQAISLSIIHSHLLGGSGLVTDIVNCGGRLVSVHETKETHRIEVRVWDVQQGTHMHSLTLDCGFACDVTAAEDTLFFIGSRRYVYAYNLETMCYHIVARTAGMCPLPDGQMLAQSDKDLYTVEVANSHVPPDGQFTRLREFSCMMLYVPCGRVIICTSDGKLSVWQ